MEEKNIEVLTFNNQSIDGKIYGNIIFALISKIFLIIYILVRKMMIKKEPSNKIE